MTAEKTQVMTVVPGVILQLTNAEARRLRNYLDPNIASNVIEREAAKLVYELLFTLGALPE